MISLQSHSGKDSYRLGRILGEQINSPLIITLEGALGAGKTCFTQGLAAGLGVPDTYYITSPSYSLINEYPGRLPLYHIDLYRLEDVSQCEDIGLDEILTSESVSVIEWAERLGSELPEFRLHVSIEIVSDEKRHLMFTPYGETANDVIKAFQKNIGYL